MISSKTILLFFTAGLLACSTSSDTVSGQQSIEKAAKDDKQHYLALGDSYTVGEAVKAPNTYPFILTDLLNRNGYNFASPTVIAKTGWRTDELIQRLSEFNPPRKYDLVSLLIGVNNQYQNKTIEEFKEQFAQLLETASTYSKRGTDGMFVLSIPDYGVMPAIAAKDRDRIASEISNYNAICKEICSEFNIRFYDISPISKRAKDDFSLVAIDKLHPSEKMYHLWIKAYYHQIVSELVKKDE